MTNHADSTPKRIFLPVLLVLCIGALPVGMYRGHRLVLQGFGTALSRGLGVPVTIEDVWATHWRGAVFKRVRIGGSQPLLTIERLEVAVNPQRMLRLLRRGHTVNNSAIRQILLKRPVLHLSEGRLSRWISKTQRGHAGLRACGAPCRQPAPLPNPPPNGGRANTKETRRAQRVSVQPPNIVSGQPINIVVDNGSVHLELPLGDQRLTFHSEAVSIQPGKSGNRLLLGKTSLSLGHHHLVDLSGAAADLDPRHGFRPIRGAAMGGRLFSGPGSMGLTIHLSRFSRQDDGYLLLLQGEMGKSPTGKLSLRAELDQQYRPTPQKGLRLSLHDVDLTPLQPHLIGLGLNTTGTRVNGQISLLRQGEDYQATASLDARGVALNHKLLAHKDILLDRILVEGELSFNARGSRMEFHSLRARTGALDLSLKGSLAFEDERAAIDLRLDMPATPCHKVLTSLPKNFAPALNGMVLRGDLGVQGVLRLDSADLDQAAVDLSLSPMKCRVLVDPPEADVNKLKQEYTIRIQGPGGATRKWVLGPSNPHFVPIKHFPGHLKAAFIVAEDNRFFHHDGFDEKQLRRAFVTNLKEGRPARGASTISQQVIKNIFLSHRRDLSRKFQEAVLTWRLEQRISKQRILELYLNLVEMGPGLYGIGHASEKYFGQSHQRLTPLQSVHLAALTPSPRILSRALRDGRPSPSWMRRLHLLLRLMSRNGVITKADQRRYQAVTASQFDARPSGNKM